MTVHTVDPGFFSNASAPLSERHGLPVTECQPRPLDNPIGAFRGLAFALLFDTIAAVAGLIVWHLLHHLH